MTFLSIGDRILDLITDVSGLTHFVNRVWHAVSSLFDFLGGFIYHAINSVSDFFSMVKSLTSTLAIAITLIPPFVSPWIGIFITVGLSALALSIILELL